MDLWAVDYLVVYIWGPSSEEGGESQFNWGYNYDTESFKQGQSECFCSSD